MSKKYKVILQATLLDEVGNVVSHKLEAAEVGANEVPGRLQDVFESMFGVASYDFGKCFDVSFDKLV